MLPIRMLAGGLFAFRCTSVPIRLSFDVPAGSLG